MTEIQATTAGDAMLRHPRSPMYFSAEEEQRFRSRWDAIQASFVDEPRDAVARADELVNDITERIIDALRRERSALESQWSRGDDVSTEDLRTCLQQYRSYSNDLLARGR